MSKDKMWSFSEAYGNLKDFLRERKSNSDQVVMLGQLTTNTHALRFGDLRLLTKILDYMIGSNNMTVINALTKIREDQELEDAGNLDDLNGPPWTIESASTADINRYKRD